MQKVNNHNRKTARGPWEYFHDCPICHGMKRGRGQSVEDLKKLFEEAEMTKGKTA